MRVLVTGANGFVGREVVAALAASGHEVRAVVRRPTNRALEGVVEKVIPDFGVSRTLTAAVEGCDAVVHLAGRAHVLEERLSDPLAEYRRVNVGGTEAVLAAAADQGVARCVVVSSIKVNGEGGQQTPYQPSDLPEPADPYGVSKHEAEVRAEAFRGRMMITILRPPLVYGPGVRGNFRRLLSLLDRAHRVPLPLGALHNRRSLVYLGNLASAIVHLATITPAADGTFLVSDGDDFSTTQLIRRTSRALGRNPILVPVPGWVLRICGRMFGRSQEIHRLTEPLTVDISSLLESGWHPPYSVDHGLDATARWWREGGRDEVAP